MTLHGKREFADVLELRILRLEDYPGLFGWAQCNHRGPCKRKGGRSVQEAGMIVEVEVGVMWGQRHRECTCEQGPPLSPLPFPRKGALPLI